MHRFSCLDRMIVEMLTESTLPLLLAALLPLCLLDLKQEEHLWHSSLLASYTLGKRQDTQCSAQAAMQGLAPFRVLCYPKWALEI